MRPRILEPLNAAIRSFLYHYLTAQRLHDAPHSGVRFSRGLLRYDLIVVAIEEHETLDTDRVSR